MRPAFLTHSLALLSLVAFVAPRSAHAAWPNNPFTNLPVCTLAGDQQGPLPVLDGAGGAIIAWSDNRSGNFDIYAQHVLAGGTLDSAWPLNGRAICTAAGNQFPTTILADGAGGAIIAWSDNRTGNFDIYAHHLLASGAVDPAWPVDGRAVCTATNSQVNPMLVSDGGSGVIVSWQDSRGGATSDIYAHHVLASGAVDPAWPIDGRALCTAANDQLSPVLVADGAGGAIVTWQDRRGGATYDVYAQHVLAGGAVDPSWPTDGRVLCNAADDQQGQTIVSDLLGGAIVVWYDWRTGTADIYAQHVLASGVVDALWPVNGRGICTAAGAQQVPTCITDGGGGAIVTWIDPRSGPNDIYAHHLLATGLLDAGWPVDGRALSTAANSQVYPTIVGDGLGGAIVTWADLRTGLNTYDVYAHHVLASGSVDPSWPVDGRAVSTANSSQSFPLIVGDGAGGAIITWYDYRANGTTTDIYAQRVARFGYLGTPEGEIVSVRDVPNDNGGVTKLSWNASYLDLNSDPNLSAYDVLRSVPPNVALARAARGAPIVHEPGEALRAGRKPLFVTQEHAQTYYWELLGSVTALHYVSGYSYLAPTASDSTANGNPRTGFMVVARNSGGSMFWPSRPDSGYSVDNLPPSPPAPFAGTYSAGIAQLHWGPNSESDLATYRLYRGTYETFVPSPANRIASPTDPVYTDPAGSMYYYKLSAVDVHGNESGFTTLLPTGTVDVSGTELPREVSLAPPAPNPAGEPMSLRYALPREARVELAIYDASGRRVRSLVSEVETAGEHRVGWDLRDDGGRAVGAGLYFVRLDADGRRITHRIATLR